MPSPKKPSDETLQISLDAIEEKIAQGGAGVSETQALYDARRDLIRAGAKSKADAKPRAARAPRAVDSVANND